MKKKTKGIIIGTIVAGIVSAAFFGGQKIIKIINPGSSSSDASTTINDELTPLNAVTNINFDEESRTLTFDGVEGGKIYAVLMTNENLDFRYSYETPVNSVQVEMIPNSLTGDLFNFSIVSKGDYVTTSNSEPATYNYTLQHETERLYSNYTDSFYRVIQAALNKEVSGGVQLDSIDTINYTNNNFYVKGFARDYENKDFYYEIDATPKTTPTDFASPEIISIITASMRNFKTLSTVFTEGFVDVTSGLLESDAFKHYTDQGYVIEKLQQTNSGFTNLGNGYRSFTVNGIYQATGLSGDKVTFEANHTVTMQDNASFVNNNEYFDYFNETGDATISDGTVSTYNADLMNHLEIMQEVHSNQSSEASKQNSGSHEF